MTLYLDLLDLKLPKNKSFEDSTYFLKFIYDSRIFNRTNDENLKIASIYYESELLKVNKISLERLIARQDTRNEDNK